MSRPARGAWIETVYERAVRKACARRAPHGARGLKLGLIIQIENRI